MRKRHQFGLALAVVLSLVAAGVGIAATSQSAQAAPAGRTISGTVTLPSGVNTLNVYAQRDSPGEYIDGGVTVTQSGAFSITGLQATQYKVCFSTEANVVEGGGCYSTGGPVEDYAQATTIDVSQQDQSGITLSVVVGAVISGTIQSPDTSGESRVVLADTNGNDVSSFSGGTVGIVASDGSFSLKGLRAGSYRLRFEQYDQLGIDLISQEYFLTDGSGNSLFTVTAGQSLSLNIPHKAATASIAGTVSTWGFDAATVASWKTMNDAYWKSIGHASEGRVDFGNAGDVNLYQRLDGSWVLLDHRVAVPNGQQAYAVQGLAAGTYTVGFEQTNSPFSAEATSVSANWWNHESSLASADSIQLTDGQSVTSIDGSLHPTSWQPTAIGPGIKPVTIAPRFGKGSSIASAQVDLGGNSLQPFSPWSAEVHSTTVTIGSGTTDANGSFSYTASLPSGLEAGSHQIVLTGTDQTGKTWTQVVLFTVSASGTITSVTDANGNALLASTGVDPTLPAAGGLLLALAGLVLLRRRRQRGRHTSLG